MDVAIGTSLIVLTADVAMTVADKLNRPLGWTRESWTAFADRRLCSRGVPAQVGAGSEPPTTTNPSLSRRPPPQRRAQCAPQQRLNLRPEPHGQSLSRSSFRPKAGGLSRWGPLGNPAALAARLSISRDFVQA